MNAIRRCIPSLAIVAAIACSSSVLAQASWQLAYPTQSPLQDANWRGAFDEARGRGMLIHSNGQQWHWNGTTWNQFTGQQPQNRYFANIVYDAARQRVVLWSGANASNFPLQDHWEWDGVTWQQRNVTPPGRFASACAYDRARGVIVLFGGSDGVSDRNDTWEWNGTAWSNPNPVVRPSARRWSKMAFDPATQRVLLYGGLSASSGWSVETWSWNGVVWQQQTPVAPPPFRDGFVMVSDLERSRIVLHGGSQYDDATWEWDGSQWHVSTPGTPGTLLEAGGFYDTVRREVVIHGGSIGSFPSGLSNLTWRYRTDTLATAISFGAGCAGSAGTPVLINAPYTLPWLGDTMRTRVNTVPASLGALFLSSLTPTSPINLDAFGMPGCNLLVGADVLEFRTASGGVAEWTLAIPNTPTLVGLSFQQQALPLDPTANALGLAASNALTLQLGVR